MLNMKTRMFFAMDKQINRIMAEQGVRSLAITTAAGSGEAANNTYQSLIAEQGEVYVLSGSQEQEGWYRGLPRPFTGRVFLCLPPKYRGEND